MTAIVVASWSLVGCDSTGDNAGDVANLHATVRRQQIEISHLNRTLAEQKAQVEAIHAAGEVRDNVAATRRGIAARNSAGDKDDARR